MLSEFWGLRSKPTLSSGLRDNHRGNDMNSIHGIVLTVATDLLQKAIEARDDELFPDAESLAGQANDARRVNIKRLRSSAIGDLGC